MNPITIDRFIYCHDCGSSMQMNGTCQICGHTDDPIVPSLVPDLTGMTQAEAILALAAVMLPLGDVTTTNDPLVPIEQIISSDPIAAAEVDPGTAVSIVISLGPAG